MVEVGSALRYADQLPGVSSFFHPLECHWIEKGSKGQAELLSLELCLLEMLEVCLRPWVLS